MDVVAWRHGLGLQQYEQAFRDNDIDIGALPSLTAEDLKDVDIAATGHRGRTPGAIAVLRADLPASLSLALRPHPFQQRMGGK